MAPRQLLRSNEVRAPTALNDQRTDRQVRQYPNDAGRTGTDNQEFLGYLTSRVRLNAGTLDWRQGGSAGPGTGGSGGPARVYGEIPEGERDGLNQTFSVARFYIPETMRIYINGQRQCIAQDGSGDCVLVESGGAGEGFDAFVVQWAPLPQDNLMVDYDWTPIPPTGAL